MDLAEPRKTERAGHLAPVAVSSLITALAPCNGPLLQKIHFFITPAYNAWPERPHSFVFRSSSRCTTQTFARNVAKRYFAFIGTPGPAADFATVARGVCAKSGLRSH